MKIKSRLIQFWLMFILVELDQPWFNYDYWKCLFVDPLIEYIGPPNFCSIMNVAWLIKFEAVV